MQRDQHIIQRAQMLLTLEYSLTQIRDILLQEGYSLDEVEALMNATEEALDYLAPMNCDQNTIGIDIIRSDEDREEHVADIDIFINKKTGKINLVTPQYQETWRVASELKKVLGKQRGKRKVTFY
ncbi:MAG: hypothetical protein LBT32_01240 [Peptococcaceae bacterium]|jgi:hypothetical protein|nr:hypothetical protein [Peptococcaceae bacterium]